MSTAKVSPCELGPAQNEVTREGQSYSHSGHLLLGLVVPRVTGMSVGAYAEKRLFDPLGMMRTCYQRDPERIGENVAIGHAAQGEGKYRRTHVDPDTREWADIILNSGP